MATDQISHLMRNASLASLALATVSGTALAQDATTPQAAQEASASDIVVTAQFRAQNLQDTPIAITAMNAEMMEARSQTGLSDIAQTAPNVTIRQSVSSAIPSFLR